MSFLRAKKVDGKVYWYKVESKRYNGKVRQKILEYYGRTNPKQRSDGNGHNQKS